MKIALIAHDKKKEEIIDLAKKYKEVLAEYELYATGTTGTQGSSRFLIFCLSVT